MSLEQTLKDLHDSEIPANIQLEPLHGVYVRVGTSNDHDPSQAWWARHKLFGCDDIEKITQWLTDTAIQLYPESEFARKHGK